MAIRLGTRGPRSGTTGSSALAPGRSPARLTINSLSNMLKAAPEERKGERVSNVVANSGYVNAL